VDAFLGQLLLGNQPLQPIALLTLLDQCRLVLMPALIEQIAHIAVILHPRIQEPAQLPLVGLDQSLDRLQPFPQGSRRL